VNSTQRRARVEAKRHPEKVYSEDELLAFDRAVNEIKPTPEYFAASHSFALSEQARQDNRGMQ
jgi:hypothetical protein